MPCRSQGKRFGEEKESRGQGGAETRTFIGVSQGQLAQLGTGQLE